jgi:hypothetical protein
MHLEGPFYNKAGAAEYLGYKKSYFDKLLERYDIPKCGPARNRYAKSVLDAFMQHPKAFEREKTKPRARTPQLLTVE